MKKIPVGVDDFKKLRENDFYCVDKTLFIKELLDRRGEINVFTRPRRFGKTLNLSMLCSFFEKESARTEAGSNSGLFDGLLIMDAGEEYTKHMGQYPVIFLSLKSGKQPDFEMAYDCIIDEIIQEFRRHNAVLESDRLTEDEKEQFIRLRSRKASKAEYAKSLFFLSACLAKAYGKKTIILLDEYDVPLENAWFRGFYGQMADFIRSLFESAFKSNENLEFAVIMGCLRIAKESIFTGLNNLDMVSILNEEYAQYFGFTMPEAERMAKDFGLVQKLSEMREWYDGYLFGKTEVYNPWSVINYVKFAANNREAWPRPYWANTSSNDIVKKLVEGADTTARREIEELIAGGTIEKPVHEDITYYDIDKSQDNLWNFLFFTGYLKKVKARFAMDMVYLTMKIPNVEVRYIYRNTVLEWFDRCIRKKDLSVFHQGLLKQDTATVEKALLVNLMETISFYDYQEDYYHGYLAGLLKSMDGYIIKSNRESGMGRSDIMVLSPVYEGVAIIIEVKVADTLAGLTAAAQKALRQIEEKQYDAELKLEGYHTFYHYGFSFYKKMCKVLTK